MDDQPLLLHMVERILGRLGYRVEKAASGEDALRRLHRDASGIDVVLSDLRMPGMPGWTLAERVRARWPHLPVVFMSGEPHLLSENGQDGSPVVEKPFTPAELRALLAGALSAPPAGGEAARQD